MRTVQAAEPLDSPEEWSGLESLLGGGGFEAVASIIQHLKELGAKSYIVEEKYIDRDYSSDYSHFYARTFRHHDQHCKRVHFFSDDAIRIYQGALSSEILEQLRDLAAKSYCGFCVLRPLPNAPIGRTVLKGEIAQGNKAEPTLTCRANYNANLLGIDLRVTGSPFLQQDSRVGACAQAAIWVGMRHLHTRYDYDWCSVADITSMALPMMGVESDALPAGSDRLSVHSMVHAIRQAGYQPLILKDDNGDIGQKILPYVESGIPTVLGLRLDGDTGHAVTVVGRVFTQPATLGNKTSDYVSAYIVQDDQAGPYKWLPMDGNASTQLSFREKTIKRKIGGVEIELNILNHATFAVALISPRVFSTAIMAENTVKSRLQDIIQNLPNIINALVAQGHQQNAEILNELKQARDNNGIVLRTYLSSTAGYRRHLVKSSASDNLKNALLDFHLPHFTWITEISTSNQYNRSLPENRFIYGHAVIDATSTVRGKNGLLALHLPGLLVTNSDGTSGKEKIVLISNDCPYECREKGL